MDKEDIALFYNFLESNSLGDIKGVQAYYDGLSLDVKEELEMLLEDRVITELHHYLSTMTNFFNECKESKSEIVFLLNF